MGILIKNGTILTAENEFKADILVEGEKIVAIGEHLHADAERVIQAEGKYVFPGGIDQHTPVSYTHLDVYKRQLSDFKIHLKSGG